MPAGGESCSDDEHLKDQTLDHHTSTMLADLLDQLGGTANDKSSRFNFFYEQHWYEGITFESAKRINELLRALGDDLICGNLAATPTIAKTLAKWQRGLEARLGNLQFCDHSQSRSLIKTLAGLNRLIPFLSSGSVTSFYQLQEMQDSVQDALRERKMGAGDCWRFAAAILKTANICERNRDALMDAFMLPLAGEHRYQVPEKLEQAIPAAEDQQAFLAYAARRENHHAWAPVRQLLQERCTPKRRNETRRIISASILQARDSADKAHAFKATVMPLRTICQKATDDEIADMLRDVLDARGGRNDLWLLHLYSHAAALTANDADADFKARLHAGLKKLCGCDAENETLATALFRFALERNLMASAELLCGQAADEMDLPACLRECISKIDDLDPEECASQIAPLARAICARMSAEEHESAMDMVDTNFNRLRDFRHRLRTLPKPARSDDAVRQHLDSTRLERRKLRIIQDILRNAGEQSTSASSSPPARL
jgi:hypothetical protein